MKRHRNSPYNALLEHYERLEMVRNILNAPPELERIERPVYRGRLVAEFTLPLLLCQTGNLSHSWRQRHGRVIRCYRTMAKQDRRDEETLPLPGRPQVLCLRISSVEPDKYSDWAKVPVDRLQVGKWGLGYIRNDRPEDCEVHQWWERGKPSKGFVWIGVMTG